MPDKFYVFVPKSAKKSIKKIPLPWQFRIMQALSALEVDPYFGERMAGKLQGKRKIRIWPYRIIYQIDAKKKIVMIVEIGHRGGMSYK